MKWLTFPAWLLLQNLGLSALLRILLAGGVLAGLTMLKGQTLVGSVVIYVVLYVSLSSLWLLGRSTEILIQQCLDSQDAAPVAGTGASALPTLSSNLQQRLAEERRQQLLLQQRLDEISHSSLELEESAVLVTRNAEDQGQSASTAAGAVEELNVSIVEVADLASASREASERGSAELAEGVEQLTLLVQQVSDMAQKAAETNTLIQQLNENSRTINEMSDTIRGIAEQTNLLALNAAIEAARAGQSGRGFAVVSDEVRRLAQSSQVSANEITRNIGAVQQYIENASEQVSEQTTLADRSAQSSEAVRKVLLGVQQRIGQLTDQVLHVAVSTKQQGQAVSEIATLAEHVRQGSDDNQRAADQARAIAHHLANLTR